MRNETLLKFAAGLILITLIWTNPVPAEEPLPVLPATPPEKAVQTIRLQDGFRAELIAAEPLVTDPVDIAYDENGLAYVVEMTDYPYVDPTDDKPWMMQNAAPIGRIRVLEDTDGDGIYDRSDIFAEGLSWPAGVVCWKGGIYVAATPDFLYLKDTDGDRRADIKRKVFSGFRKYNVQAIMNNPRFGLDHQIYVAGSSNGGQIAEEGSESGRELGRNDFAFDPFHEKLEILSGSGRFGHSMDDWGNRFLTNIRNPIQHVLFPSRYLKRNPYLQLPRPIHDVAESGDAVAVYRVSPPESWREIYASRVSNSHLPVFVDTAAAVGYVTSSSGVTIYRGAAYPKEFYGNAFVGEVAGNLVMRYLLEPDGATFVGKRPYEKVDFMASTDNWFRAVNFANAPDGTLHVLDMYRQTIEHPWSLPEDLKKRLDLTAGRDRGRIFRLVPPAYAEGFVPPPQPKLGSASVEELVSHLENPNSWWRETSHRLLYERQDQAAVPHLRQLLRESASPLAKLHALWSLNGLNQLTKDDIQFSLEQTEPRFLPHAIRLSEPYLATDAEIFQQVAKLSQNPEKPVRFQVALSLGYGPTEKVIPLLVNILKQDGSDPWMRAAVLSSISGHELALLKDLMGNLKSTVATEANSVGVLNELALTVGARNKPAEVLEIFDRIAGLSEQSDAEFKLTPIQQTISLSLARGLKRKNITLASLAETGNSPGSEFLKTVLKQAAKDVASEQTPVSERLTAIRVLEFDTSENIYQTLERLVSSQTPVDVQRAAIQTLCSSANSKVPALLLDRYRSLTPSQQQLIVDQLIARSAWLPPLFDAIEAGTVDRNRIAEVRQEIFRNSPSEPISLQANRIFKKQPETDFSELIKDYEKQMPTQGDAGRGLAVYQKNCANCHKLGEHGYEVGPHLSTVKARSVSELLVSILDPNREVAPNYLAYLAITHQGLTHTGVVTAETNANLTLRGADRNEIVLFTNEIDELVSTNKSLMPAGLEKSITPAEMADLITLLKEQ